MCVQCIYMLILNNNNNNNYYCYYLILTCRCTAHTYLCFITKELYAPLTQNHGIQNYCLNGHDNAHRQFSLRHTRIFQLLLCISLPERCLPDICANRSSCLFSCASLILLDLVDTAVNIRPKCFMNVYTCVRIFV